MRTVVITLCPERVEKLLSGPVRVILDKTSPPPECPACLLLCTDISDGSGKVSRIALGEAVIESVMEADGQELRELYEWAHHDNGRLSRRVGSGMLIRMNAMSRLAEESGLSPEEMLRRLGHGVSYAWLLRDIIRYAEPRRLEEYGFPDDQPGVWKEIQQTGGDINAKAKSPAAIRRGGAVPAQTE